MTRITSANTSINQLPAVAKLVDAFSWWYSDSVNLDIGAGKYNVLTEYLNQKGVENFSYDPYNRPAIENLAALKCHPNTVTISNVLNVIVQKKDRINVLRLARKVLRPGGCVFITVYEGDRSGAGRVSKKDCWQENRKTQDYIEEIQSVFGDIRIYGKLLVCFGE
jgi:hypothetical protein